VTPVVIASITAIAASALLTPMARAAGRRLGRLDVPNERSSHRVPTPRTGGYAIFAALILGLGAAGTFQDRGVAIVVVAAILLAALAVIDETRPLNRKMRFVVQIAVAAAALLFSATLLGAIDVHFLPPVPMHQAAIVVSLFWVVGLINAYNFMDGVNGIASLEAIICGVSIALLSLRAGDAIGATLAAAVAGAAAGFLPWNLPSGSIFMGDVGSATIGFLLGVLTIRLTNHGVSIVAAALPLAPFLFDSAVTIVRRAINGEAFFSTPHRSHFYQRLNRLGWSHTAVTALWGTLAVVCAATASIYDSLRPALAAGVLCAVIAMHVAVALWITRREHAAALA
jgi:UDP-GlcNAc:undecaprenyl-phosphate GlcNAc-1-phosphate transferase